MAHRMIAAGDGGLITTRTGHSGVGLVIRESRNPRAGDGVAAGAHRVGATAAGGSGMGLGMRHADGEHKSQTNENLHCGLLHRYNFRLYSSGRLDEALSDRLKCNMTAAVGA